jgi:restriction system protein
MRRRRTSAYEDLLEIASKLPWWLGLALAVVFYVWLHHVATEPMPTAPTDMKNLGGLMAGMYWRAFASVLRYILPVICLLGAAVSAYRRFGPGRGSPGGLSDAQAAGAWRATSSAGSAGSAPPCPQCGAPMKHRTARKGAKAGSSFWGCSRYPQCRGTLDG